jgi:hypothetical protein
MASLDVSIHMDKPVDLKTYQKMTFLLNALEQGWSIRKQNDLYIFSKKHEGKREVFKDSYLEDFLLSNFLNTTVS